MGQRRAGTWRGTGEHCFDPDASFSVFISSGCCRTPRRQHLCSVQSCRKTTVPWYLPWSMSLFAGRMERDGDRNVPYILISYPVSGHVGEIRAQRVRRQPVSIERGPRIDNKICDPESRQIPVRSCILRRGEGLSLRLPQGYPGNQS